MKHMLAGAIYGGFLAVALTGLGAAIRGPQAEGLGKDLAVGAGVAGAAIAVRWAARELELDDDRVR